METERLIKKINSMIERAHGFESHGKRSRNDVIDGYVKGLTELKEYIAEVEPYTTPSPSLMSSPPEELVHA